MMTNHRDQVRGEMAHFFNCDNDGYNSFCIFAYSRFNQRMSQFERTPRTNVALVIMATMTVFI